MKKAALIIIGLVMVVGGIALTFSEWTSVQILFRGVSGPLLAVIGLVALTVVNSK